DKVVETIFGQRGLGYLREDVTNALGIRGCGGAIGGDHAIARTIDTHVARGVIQVPIDIAAGLIEVLRRSIASAVQLVAGVGDGITGITAEVAGTVAKVTGAFLQL